MMSEKERADRPPPMKDLGERLRALQWVALGIGFVAVLWLAIDYGRPPWIALTLAFSFGTYGLAKKKADVGAIEGLAVETAVLTPLALGYVVFLQQAGQSNLSLQLITTPNAPGMVQAAQVFKTQAEGAGVNTEVVNQPTTEYFARSYLKVPFSQDYWPYLPYLITVSQATAKGAPFSATLE